MIYFVVQGCMFIIQCLTLEIDSAPKPENIVMSYYKVEYLSICSIFESSMYLDESMSILCYKEKKHDITIINGFQYRLNTQF